MKKAGRYVVCVRNEGAEDLELRKLYFALPDEAAAERQHLRVVDESGEDYLYPVDWFVPVEVPKESEKALDSARGPVGTTAGRG